MGTRADFYVGKGKNAEWLGSVAYDGYRSGMTAGILKAPNEDAFRKAVAIFLKDRDDATLPEQGWPWPWDDSGTTDCSYWFFDGHTWDVSGYPKGYYAPCDKPEPERYTDKDKKGDVEYPDMSARKNVTLGPRSGVMIITGR